MPKVNGGNRPIAIGDSVLRLLLRVLNAKYAGTIGKRLEPLQVAVGTSGGCEIIAALAQHSFSNHDYTLTLDLHSAFNQVWRRAIAEGLVIHAPGLLRIFKSLYGRPSELRSNTTEGRSLLVGRSMRGCKQGDPLSMLYFAVAIHAWLRSVNTLVIDRHAELAPDTTSFAIAYADDIALGGNPDVLCSCLPNISDSLSTTTGLRVTTNKCKLFGLDPNALHEEPALSISHEGSVLVGVPIGTDAFQRAHSTRIIDDAGRGASRVANATIPAQVKFALIAKCVNARPQYLCRNVHPYALNDTLAWFDREIDAALERIVGAPLDPHRAQLRGLPFSHAGCSLRRHKGSESINAFNNRVNLVSLFFRSYNHVVPAMQHVLDALSAREPIPFVHHDPLNHPVSTIKEEHNIILMMVQSGIEQEQDGLAKLSWIQSGTHTGAADTTYTASGKFLQWSGGLDLRWHMANNIFVSALRRRLCLPETNTPLACPHVHQHRPPGSHVNLADHFGHQLTCTVGITSGVHNRHNYICGSLSDLLRSDPLGDGPVPANVVAREVDVGHKPDGTVLRADVIFTENHNQQNAIRIVIDVTVPEPYNRHGIGRLPGAAVEHAAIGKIADYAAVAREPNTVFVPFALDSNGHIGSHATSFLNRLKQGNPAYGPRIKHFLQEVSFHLAKQTAVAAEAGRAAAYQALWHH